MLQAFVFRGGPHDGEHIDNAEGPPTLFVISFADGADYARAGVRLRDDKGTPREVFRFDADGSLSLRARREFTDLD